MQLYCTIRFAIISKCMIILSQISVNKVIFWTIKTGMETNK